MICPSRRNLFRTAYIFLLGNLVLVASARGQTLSDLTRWEEGRSMRAGSNVWVEDDLYDKKNNLDRPDRIEPRAVKRRPKKAHILNEPRNIAKARLLTGT